MNIRFSICAFILLAGSAGALFAQTVTTKVQPAALPLATQPSDSSGQASLSKLPDEKTLLIPDGTSGRDAAKAPKGVGIWDFVQMILILGIVVGAIYLLFRFLRRAGNKTVDNNLIDVLSTKALQPNRSLHLVEIGNQLYLVGSSEGSVSLVAAIQDKETIDEIHLKAAQRGNAPAKKSFRDVLGTMFTKGVGGGTIGAPIIDPFGFMRQQRSRLKKL